VYRDLKPENLLLDEVGHLKLVDFGSCCRERLPTAAAAGDGVDGEAASGDAGRPADTRRFVGTAEYVSPEVLGDGDATAASDLWALGAIAYQMLAGAPPFTAGSDYLVFKRIEALDFSFPAHFPPPAASLVSALLAREPQQRLGAGGAYAELRAHPLFDSLDFASLHLQPPPPLAPPPPLPRISGAKVMNPQLASRALAREERPQLLSSQADTPWGAAISEGEIIVLGTPVLKRRFLSVKSRQLLLVDAPLSTPPPPPPPAYTNFRNPEGSFARSRASESHAKPPLPPATPLVGGRLVYVDPEKLEVKGEIPFSSEFDAELGPRGAFYVRPAGERGRTYYFEDPAGDEVLAETWVRTLLRFKARLVDEARAR